MTRFATLRPAGWDSAGTAPLEPVELGRWRVYFTDVRIGLFDEKTGEVLYTVRTASNRFRPPVYSPGPFTLKAGPDRPNEYRIKSLRPSQEDDKTTLTLKF